MKICRKLIFCALLLSNYSFGNIKDSTYCDTVVVFFKKYGDFEKKFRNNFADAYYNRRDTLYYYLPSGVKKIKDSATGFYYNVSWMDNCFHIFKCVSSNRELIAVGTWAGECFHSWYKQYYQNGKLMESGNYYFGRKDKTWQFFDTKGKLIREDIYKKDSLLKSINY